MERTNEHYLPRFMMDGFASKRGKKDKVKTWCFRDGMNPIETNIKNIAAEKDFHSSISGPSADDSLRPLENQFGWYLDLLRQQKNQSRMDDAVIPELIANLTVRTKAFREGLTRSTAMAIGEVIARLSDTEKLNRIVITLLGEPSCKVLNELASKLAVTVSPEYANAFTEQLDELIALMRSPFGQSLLKMQLEKVDKGFDNEFSRVAKESHVGALLNAPVPETMIAALEHLQWHLVIRDRGTFILGDVGPVFKIDKLNQAKSAPVGVYEYDAVFLPISDSHLLAGLQDDASTDVDVDQVNCFSSSCSQTFFISACNTAREENYAIKIGSSAELLDNEALNTLVDQTLRLLQSHNSFQ